MDRENEAFLPGVFQKSIDKFLAAGGPLVFQHRPQLGQLGQVTALDPTPNGLFMKAIIPKPADSSPLADIYQKIKRRMMRGLSASGPCKRVMTRGGPRISEIDLQEISVTAVPVNPRTLFAVATKALEGFDPEAAPLTHDQLSNWAEERFGATAARLDR